MSIYNFYAEEVIYYNSDYRYYIYQLFVSVDSIEEAIEIVKNDIKSHLIESHIEYLFNSPVNAYQPSKFYCETTSQPSLFFDVSSAKIILTEMFNPADSGIAVQYVISVYSDRDTIRRYEINSNLTDQDSKIRKMRRFEQSDMSKEAGTLFNIGDIVRIKHDPSDIIYTIVSKPNKSNLETWENEYKMIPVNCKVDKRKSFKYIIHESELEKVEEE